MNEECFVETFCVTLGIAQHQSQTTLINIRVSKRVLKGELKEKRGRMLWKDTFKEQRSDEDVFQGKERQR